MITRLKSYQNGVHGAFFLDVASELETQHRLAQARLETIRSMSGYLDDVAEALGVPKPATPLEGVGACWKVMEAISSLKAEGERLTAERDKYKEALKQLSKHCNDGDYWQVADEALAEAVRG